MGCKNDPIYVDRELALYNCLVLERKVKDLEKQVEGLRVWIKSLLKYSNCQKGCESNYINTTCDCGFSKLIDKMEENNG